MDRETARQTLEALQQGDLDIEAVLEAFSGLAVEDLESARIDHQRALRCGFPEVVYGAGKSIPDLREIADAFVRREQNLFITRLSPDAANAIRAEHPEAVHDPVARTLSRCFQPPTPRPGRVGVVAAGTSDRPVAHEAINSLEFFGFAPEVLQDSGVAGLHRLLQHHDRLRQWQVIIVVAGMEGALPSVVGGLVSAPVIAVPTSIGYGAGTGGFAALLGMLSSCASGVTVCNIDNGFGAACAAARILRLCD